MSKNFFKESNPSTQLSRQALKYINKQFPNIILTAKVSNVKQNLKGIAPIISERDDEKLYVEVANRVTACWFPELDYGGPEFSVGDGGVRVGV